MKKKKHIWDHCFNCVLHSYVTTEQLHSDIFPENVERKNKNSKEKERKKFAMIKVSKEFIQQYSASNDMQLPLYLLLCHLLSCFLLYSTFISLFLRAFWRNSKFQWMNRKGKRLKQKKVDHLFEWTIRKNGKNEHEHSYM